MADFATTIAGETRLVPRLTVRQIIDVQNLAAERARVALVQDLDDAGCDAETRLDRLERHRRDTDLVQYVVRQAFTVGGAHEILATAFGGEVPDDIAGLAITEQTDLALRALGLDGVKTAANAAKKDGAAKEGNA